MHKGFCAESRRLDLPCVFSPWIVPLLLLWLAGSDVTFSYSRIRSFIPSFLSLFLKLTTFTEAPLFLWPPGM